MRSRGSATAFVLVAVGLTVLHRRGLLAGLAPGDSVEPRLLAEVLAAAEATLLAMLPCIALIALRRSPRVAPAVASLTLALLAAGLYLDARVLAFFGPEQILAESLRCSGMGVHAGVPGAALVIVTGGAFALGALAFAALRVLLARAPPRVERWAGLLAVSAIALAASVVLWTSFTGDLDRQERKVRSRSLVGLASHDATAQRPWRPLHYPRAPYAAVVRPAQRPDVLLVVVESLRASALDPRTMPLTYAASARGLRALRHYTGGNCTQLALFSLLHGTNAATFAGITGAHLPSAALSWLKAQGYRLELYSGEFFPWKNLDALLFSDFDEVHEPPSLDFEPEYDEAAASAASEAFTAKDGPPRLVMLALNATHFPYDYPPRFERFGPVTTAGADYMPALRNRYVNAAGYVDALIGRLLADVEARGRGRPLVFVTGDHGEEFLEHGAFFHPSNLFDPQTLVPLVAWGLPDFPPGSTLDRVTGHEDLLPTVLHVIAPELDTSVSGTGRPLGDERPAPRLVSQCQKEDQSANEDFAAVSASHKTWFSIAGGVVGWSETRANDDAPKQPRAEPADAAEILGALAYLGGSFLEPPWWPCRSFDVAGVVFHACDGLARRDEAEAICRRHGTRLAWFDDGEQYDALVRAMDGALWPTELWLGLSRRDRDGFVWSADSPAGFSRWSDGQPSARLLDDCVLADRGQGRRWRSVRCAAETGFGEAGYVCR